MNEESPPKTPDHSDDGFADNIVIETNLDERDEEIERLKRQMVGHSGRQRGPYIECTSCPFIHGWYVGMGVSLVGWDDNGPKLKKRNS